ncbi:thioredoxin domain-containing protein [Lyticum sinuosum]|uniref:Thioredoxin-domain protein n=1 Tax=Lyticum sinuosum TaxID=1332059 RepID=A0AAE4VL79_9RICK|nr:thioredoxin domain-containing protein [Lyticum sinuosum]MDZ5761558.1 putative thioredoxin-domain protein [Lyticum sinuosum]
MFKKPKANIKSILILLLFLICLKFTDNVFCYAAHTVEINSIDFIKKVKSTKTRKIVVFFASWCGHCRTLITDISHWIDQSIKNKKNYNVEFFLFALDDNVNELHSFVNSFTNDNFNIYHSSNHLEISRIFYILRVGYRGSVPHVTIFDEKDELLFNDNADMRIILRMINKA